MAIHPIVQVYQALSDNARLQKTMTMIRGREIKENTIFRMIIPENYHKREDAPYIRIEPVNQFQSEFADDQSIACEQTVQVSILVQELSEIELLTPVIEEILTTLDFFQTKEDLYVEPDFGLYFCARLYKRTNYFN